ncbi:MAG: protein jag [Clostridia bacterium]|nr:protein jag [Clostridia bacterium]
MIREAIATGDTIEIAYERACRELGVEVGAAEQEVLAMPVKKTFGLFGGAPAKVRAFIKTSPADTAADYLREVLMNMGLTDVNVTATEEENGAVLSISGENIGFVIGHRGETLDALQYLAGLVANHAEGSYYRITLDIGSYREKRKETLEALGQKIAAKAVKYGRNFSLEPMNPYERRIIHTAVQGVEGAKSWSEGEDTVRHVVIGPEAGERPQRRGYGNGGSRGGYNRGKGGKGNGNRGGYNRDRGPRRDNASHTVESNPAAQPTVKKEAEGLPLYGRIK